PTNDGSHADGEWEVGGMPLAIAEDLQGGRARLPGQAWLRYDDEAMYVAFATPVAQGKSLVLGNTWGQCDAVEVALAFRDRPVAVLRGFANGEWTSSPEASGDPDAARRAGEGVAYAATVAPDRWIAEWRIPWAALGGRPRTGQTCHFNLSLRQTAGETWTLLRATGGSTWKASEAALLRMGRPLPPPAPIPVPIPEPEVPPPPPAPEPPVALPEPAPVPEPPAPAPAPTPELVPPQAAPVQAAPVLQTLPALEPEPAPVPEPPAPAPAPAPVPELVPPQAAPVQAAPVLQTLPALEPEPAPVPEPPAPAPAPAPVPELVPPQAAPVQATPVFQPVPMLVPEPAPEPKPEPAAEEQAAPVEDQPAKPAFRMRLPWPEAKD
ncbi:MAG: hypothetical protein RBU25_17955, partial [Lentisphaeria bacterium]|nr:hypothetical protein [Lentisphaeria bacterium]